jgi:hypothetical protein
MPRTLRQFFVLEQGFTDMGGTPVFLPADNAKQKALPTLRLRTFPARRFL